MVRCIPLKMITNSFAFSKKKNKIRSFRKGTLGIMIIINHKMAYTEDKPYLRLQSIEMNTN